MLRKVFKKILQNQRIHKFVVLNTPPEQISPKCIYVVNHSCKWDGQYCMELLPGKFYILTGKQRLKIVDRIGIWLNGVIWVDRKRETSRHASKTKMLDKLSRGKSLLIFPEGTWNLEASTPVLPLYWGVIEVAQRSATPIIPLCLEYIEDKCVVKFGEPLHISENSDKAIEIGRLRDVMATLKWDIWEMFTEDKRENITDDYWDKEVEKRLGEYKLLDYEYEMGCVRKK